MGCPFLGKGWDLVWGVWLKGTWGGQKCPFLGDVLNGCSLVIYQYLFFFMLTAINLLPYRARSSLEIHTCMMTLFLHDVLKRDHSSASKLSMNLHRLYYMYFA